MTNQELGFKGEKLARRILRKHFTNVRFHKDHRDPFDYTAIDRLTGDRVAIEVKTVRKVKGKIAHIENSAMTRKLTFLNETNRKGIVLVVAINGHTSFYLAKLQNHISSGSLVEIK